MEVLIVIVPFALAGIAVIFIAFFGGPSAAREAYLTRGGRSFTFVMVLLYLALGVAVPAAVIAGRGEAVGEPARCARKSRQRRRRRASSSSSRPARAATRWPRSRPTA